MTRFARAKGSKSSNEKLPEEATPWSELKKGMQMKKEGLTDETREKVSVLKLKSKEEKPAEWASLDNDDCINILRKHLQKRKKVDLDCDSSVKNVKGDQGESDLSVPKKKKKLDQSVGDEGDKNVKIKKKKLVKGGKAENAEVLTNKKKKKKKKLGDVEGSKDVESNNVCEEVVNKVTEVKMDNTEKKIKKKKVKKIGVEKGSDTKTSKKKTSSFERDGKKTSFAANIKQPNKKSFKTNVKDKYTTKIELGGKLVSLVKFQGFYVTKEDSKRLKELKKKMVAEGIPEGQIESALKLERRRCEKSLARMKKNVCFHCRQPGHILSQCPEMQKSIDTGTGVCYKCGSTEHNAFTCRVTHGNKFPFAECFICKEKGHIARECPDNPRGLYPKGGCCKLCGDVTHLKKDCPTRAAEMEEKVIKLNVRDERNLEGLDDVGQKVENTGSKPKKKLVKF